MQRVPGTGWSMVSALFLWVGNCRSSLRRFSMYSTPLLLKRYAFLIFVSLSLAAGSLSAGTLSSVLQPSCCCDYEHLRTTLRTTLDCKNTCIPVAKVRTTCCTYEQLNSLWNCLVVRNFTNNFEKHPPVETFLSLSHLLKMMVLQNTTYSLLILLVLCKGFLVQVAGWWCYLAIKISSTAIMVWNIVLGLVLLLISKMKLTLFEPCLLLL